MKKKFLGLIMFIMLLLPLKVSALSTSCRSSGTVTLNGTITVTVSGSNGAEVMWDTSMSHDSSKLQYIGGSSQRSISDNFSTSITYTYQFRAIAVGTASVSTNSSAADYTGNKSYSSSSCSINVVAPSSGGGNSGSSKNNNSNKNNNANKNSDNNLKSLSIEGFEISPEFNKDTLEYTLEVPSDTTKIKINAEVNDSKASVSGDGEKDVEEGENKFEIIVTAENGSTRTYLVNITVQEKEPIVVEVNGKKYTIIRKKDVIKAPEGFEETTVKINDEEIAAYKNDLTDIILVGLKNEKGKGFWYIYDETNLSYTKYLEINTKSVRLIVLEADKDIIPNGYTKVTFEANNQKIKGYIFEKKSNFILTYGANIDTGESNLYVYDKKERTLQRYYNEETLSYIELVKQCRYIIIATGSVVAFLILIIIILLHKNVKFKKNYLSKIPDKVEKKKEEIEYKSIEETRVMDPIEEPISKKELKKQTKEVKKQEKQERKAKKKEKTFLDE